MAIHFIVGAPRTGKSYFAVHHLVKKHFFYDKYNGYMQKQDVLIVSNIDGLTLPHVSLQVMIDDAGGPHVFFTNTYQECLFQDCGRILYLIDEAQKYFSREVLPTSKKDELILADIFFWFEYHGHHGQDIYLVSHGFGSIHKRITNTLEYHISVAHRKTSLNKNLLAYDYVSGGKVFDREFIIKNQSIFNLYKSSSADEVENMKSPIAKKIIIPLVCAFLLMSICGFKFYNFLYSDEAHAEESRLLANEKNNQKAQVSNNQSNGLLTGAVTSDPLLSGQRTDENKVYEKNTLSNSEDLFLKKLNVLIQYKGDMKLVFVFYDGLMLPVQEFPFEVKQIAGNYYSYLPGKDYDQADEGS